MNLACRLVLILFLPALTDVRAVVVAGANGGGNTSNNTTAVQMASQLGLGDVSFYDNVLPYSDAGSVYLGWAHTVDGPRAYLLSAVHITLSSTMLINAVSYSVTRQSISGSDIALLTLSNVDGTMPPLPVVNLSTNTPSIGTEVIMAGFGRNRVQDATTNANTPDTVTLTNGTGYTTAAPQVQRWGANATIQAAAGPPSPVATINVGTNPTVVFTTRFDSPSTGQWLTSNEAQAVLGDSGGGAFDTNGNLLGIIAAVTGSSTNPVFGDGTYFADISTYKNAIDTAIGYTLVPEPSTTVLLFFGSGTVVVFALRRRR